jgi:signal transduction histidine kinase
MRRRYAWMRWSTLAGVLLISVLTARMPPSWPGLAALLLLVGVYVGLVSYQYGAPTNCDGAPLRTGLPWYFLPIFWWKPPSLARGGSLRMAPTRYLILCSLLIFALITVPTALGEDSYWFCILFFVVAGEASRHLREARALAAMVAFSMVLVLSADFLLTPSRAWLHDSLQWLPFFLGLAASTMGGRFQMRQEEEHAARLATLQELERSKADLEQANQQLQVYAGTVEELAVANERNRLARELHDILGYTLATVVVKAEAAKRLLAADPARASAELDRVQEIARSGLAEVRRSVSGLRDAAQAPSVWHEVACKFVTDFGRETQIETECAIEPLPCGHDPELQVTLFRIIQESLTNVARHAHARHVAVTLRRVGESVEMAIQDDGVGMAPGQPAGGFGLRGMRERVTLSGGQLVVSSRYGYGTRILAMLPLRLTRVDAAEPSPGPDVDGQGKQLDKVHQLAEHP